MTVKILPFTANGEIVAPPSKSVAHRLIISAMLKKGKTFIKNVGKSADVTATLNCAEQLGATVTRCGEDVLIDGIKNLNKDAVLDCNESGSTLRFLMPVACALGANATFTGSSKLLSRPSDALISALTERGIRKEGWKLLGKLSGGEFLIDASISSQYVTGLLFALPILESDSEIIMQGETVSKDYINVTLSTLDKCGIEYKKSGNSIFIKGNQEYKLPDEITVEGDWSGSAFPLALGAINGKVSVLGLDLNSKQGDKEILEIIKKAGAKVEIEDGKITVTAKPLKGFDYRFENIPDLAPISAVIAGVAEGESVFSGIERLKIKESDRIATTVQTLNSADIFAKEESGKLRIVGSKPKACVYDGANDHRIVMSASVLASVANGESVIVGSEAVNKSYPDFFEHFKLLGGKTDGVI